MSREERAMARGLMAKGELGRTPAAAFVKNRLHDKSVRAVA